jgi:hypothetical protein
VSIRRRQEIEAEWNVEPRHDEPILRIFPDLQHILNKKKISPVSKH